MKLRSSLLPLLSSLAAVNGAHVSLPSQFSAKIMLEMPYIGLAEPLFVAFDSVTGLQTMSYWDGMDTYIYDSRDDGTSYQIIPTAMDGISGVETCWKFGQSSPVPLFPDFSTFTADEGTSIVNGHECNSFSLVQKEFNSTSGKLRWR